jgi:hypothetical protein
MGSVSGRLIDRPTANKRQGSCYIRGSNVSAYIYGAAVPEANVLSDILNQCICTVASTGMGDLCSLIP